MTPKEIRRQLREQRKQLRQKLPELKRQARARVDQNPMVRRERNRRRIRRAVTAVILIILACLIRCDCGPPPPLPEPVKIEQAAPPVVKPRVVVAPPMKKKPLRATMDANPRPQINGEARPPPTWIDEFRLEVSARSSRLSLCFTGSERPGALRWTSSVNPESGAVSDHELEPVGGSSEIGRDQRNCLIKALSDPPYKLTHPANEALPNRVSLVIEF